MINIFIDADNNPVIKEIIKLIAKYNLHCYIISDISHDYSKYEGIRGLEIIKTDSHHDAADYRIVNMSKKGDIVITRDYGLMSLVIGKGCKVIHPKGGIITEKEIDFLLVSRYIKSINRKNGIYKKGNSVNLPNLIASKEGFYNNFENLIKTTIKENQINTNKERETIK